MNARPPFLPPRSRCRIAPAAFLVVALLVLPSFAGNHPELEAAIGLIHAKRFPEARAAFEKIVAADPQNAEACHQLGLLLKRRHDHAGWEEALQWLARAVELAPENPIYLGDFGGTSLQYAGRMNSYAAATRGRDAMLKAVALDPDYLDAREGLYQFYVRAPWPLGSDAKAAEQLEQIRRRNPDLATVLEVVTRTNAKDYAAAFAQCDRVLTKAPDNYTALYHFGRTASISGENLERGLVCLQKCLTLDPPTPASPSHSHVWQRIGHLHERLGQPDKARAAYTTALELDPGNSQATEALAKLK